MRVIKLFKKSGSDLKKAKMFGNVVQKPIICGPPNSLILELISPMERHLLLVVVNHLFKASKDVWPDIEQLPRALHK